jgi:DNA-binding response OmpR family regulator
MTRVLLIESDRALAQALAIDCVDLGIAVRLAETLCDGVRVMMDSPVSLVLIDAALMRLPASDQLRLFDAVAPGVPVVVLADDRASTEDVSKLRTQGFQVVAWPVDVLELFATIGRPARPRPTRVAVTDRTEALCSG